MLAPKVSITSPTGTAFNINGSNANVTYSGNITQASNAAMVSITDHASGTVTLKFHFCIKRGSWCRAWCSRIARTNARRPMKLSAGRW